jgi:Ca2+-binding RTX toxin-like protein
MGKIFISADLRILPGQLVLFGDDGSNPVVGYVLQDVSSPAASFRNAGTVTVASALNRVVGFAHDNGLFNGALFHNERTGVFRVTSTAINGSAWGFDSGSWSADFLNDGQFKVTSKYAFATGIETWDSSFRFTNTGAMKIEARMDATGVFMANGGEFNNAGTLKVTGNASSVGAFLRGHNVEKVYNSGQLIAESKNGVSIALYVQQFGDTTALIFNSGVLQGDYAIVSDDYGVSPSAKSIQIVDNTGQIKGDVDLGLNNDIVRNSGTIVGGVYLGEGDDLYQGVTGRLNGGVSGGGGNDTILGGDSAERFFGDAGLDEIRGGAGNDSIDGGRGSDVLDGGEGKDTLSFQTATAAISVDLAAGTARGDGTDTIRNFEIVVGSAYADHISGSDNADVLEGADGADILIGGAGADILIGDQLGDTLTGGAGDDRFLFSRGGRRRHRHRLFSRRPGGQPADLWLHSLSVPAAAGGGHPGRAVRDRQYSAEISAGLFPDRGRHPLSCRATDTATGQAGAISRNRRPQRPHRSGGRVSRGRRQGGLLSERAGPLRNGLDLQFGKHPRGGS